MPLDTPHQPGTDPHLESLATLFANGYTDEVRAFTKSIQTNPQAVLGFEIIFDRLNEASMIDWEGTPSQDASMAHIAGSHHDLQILSSPHFTR